MNRRHTHRIFVYTMEPFFFEKPFCVRSWYCWYLRSMFSIVYTRIELYMNLHTNPSHWLTYFVHIRIKESSNYNPLSPFIDLITTTTSSIPPLHIQKGIHFPLHSSCLCVRALHCICSCAMWWFVVFLFFAILPVTWWYNLCREV